jgi:hypothetical protein
MAKFIIFGLLLLACYVVSAFSWFFINDLNNNFGFNSQTYSQQQLDSSGNIRFFGVPKDGPAAQMMQDMLKNPLSDFSAFSSQTTKGVSATKETGGAQGGAKDTQGPPPASGSGSSGAGGSGTDESKGSGSDDINDMAAKYSAIPFITQTKVYFVQLPKGDAKKGQGGEKKKK